MGGGSDNPPPPQQTTTFQMSPEQRELMNLALPGIRSFAANVPQRYQGTTIADFTAPQTSGQQMALGAAGTQADLSGMANRTFGRLTTDLTDPSQNPQLAGAITASTRPIMQTLTESALPAIRGGAQGAGQYGCSRQALAEGIATRGAEQAVGDTAAKLAQSTYETNMRSQLQALGLLPTVQTGAVTPALTTSGVGDVQQALEQQKLNQQVAGFNYDQLAPYLQSRDLLSIMAGLPGGTNISTGMNPPQASGGQKALSGALQGASFGASLGSIVPGVGTLAGAGIGAGAGALMPFLM